jgi:hypothetical protein
LLVRVATIIELGNHEIYKQSILKFDILINSHIVYSNIWSPYLVKVRMSVAILSHISGNEIKVRFDTQMPIDSQIMMKEPNDRDREDSENPISDDLETPTFKCPLS